MPKHIYIIYNPNSTGDGKDNAQSLKNSLSAADTTQSVELVPTKHAGHARTLARDLAKPDVMIISSSGDGGFHEVINGVLESSHPETIVGLLPSGNANDHYHSEHDGDITQRIMTNDIKTATVLRVAWGDTVLYAHSYAGVGFTADIGHALTQTKLNPLNELLIVLRGLLYRRSVRLIIDGTSRRYDSLVYAVSRRMSKYIHTGAEHTDSNEFVVMKTPRRNLWWLLSHLVHRTTATQDPLTVSSARFTTTRQTRIQCDGEVITIPANTTVNITAEPILREII